MTIKVAIQPVSLQLVCSLSPRDLDVLIAEKVFHLKVVARDWPCGYDPECGHYAASYFLPPVGHWWTGKDAVYIPEGDKWPPERTIEIDPEAEQVDPDERFAWVEPVPFYSTDIAAAWTVVEKVNDCLHLRQHGKDGLWSVMFCGKMTEEVSGETAMVAICRAALFSVLT